jgi:hypothetical protein
LGSAHTSTPIEVTAKDFLARRVKGGWTARGRAIAANQKKALHVDPASSLAEVFTTAGHLTPYVYFLTTPGPPEVCDPEVPLTYPNVGVYRIGPGNRFDLSRWRGTGGITYTLTAEAGVLHLGAARSTDPGARSAFFR